MLKQVQHLRWLHLLESEILTEGESDTKIDWELCFVDTKPAGWHPVSPQAGQSYYPVYYTPGFKPQGTGFFCSEDTPPKPELSNPPPRPKPTQLQTALVDFVGHGPMEPK